MNSTEKTREEIENSTFTIADNKQNIEQNTNIG